MNIAHNTLSFEMIDDLMQDGYKLVNGPRVTEACDLWLKVWKAVVRIVDAYQMKTLAEFDKNSLAAHPLGR